MTFNGIKIDDLYVKVTTYEVWGEDESGSGFGISRERIIKSFEDKKEAEEFRAEEYKRSSWDWVSIRKSENFQRVKDYLYLKEYDRNR